MCHCVELGEEPPAPGLANFRASVIIFFGRSDFEDSKEQDLLRPSSTSAIYHFPIALIRGSEQDATIMRFLNPCNDWAFKRIFGSRESGAVLIGFLNDLLYNGEPVVTEVTILDPYLPAQIRLLKDSAVDVRARLSTGADSYSRSK
jgi:PD-(D/E)XK nuclease family transposase